MARAEPLNIPWDNLPTWVVAMLAIVTTLGLNRAWAPLGKWIGRRLDVQAKVREAERATLIDRLSSDLKDIREEAVELRKDLGEERELRMALAMENAVLTERVDQIQAHRNEDKRECELAIRALRREIVALQKRDIGA